MQQQLIQLIRRHWLEVALGLVFYALTTLLTHKSQIDAWCMANPKRAGVMKIVRAIIPGDPWLLVQGLTLLTKSRLPNYILKILGAAVAVSVLMGCSPKYSFVSARDSDGDAYQFCFKVVGSALAFTGRTMGCADVESQTAQLEQAFQATHPGAKTVRVRQLKVATE